MGKVYYDLSEKSEWVRYRDGLWIPARKRVYLYWFKYLQEAELAKEYEVDWNKYSGWGGANYVLGVKFDEFWEERWKDLFGTKERNQTPKFPISTSRPKTEGIRLALLCWQKRNSKPLKRKMQSNMTGIAKAVYEYELGISGEKKERYTQDEFGAYNLNPSPDKYRPDPSLPEMIEVESDDDLVDVRNDIRKLITRYLRNAKRYLKNVSVGQFP